MSAGRVECDVAIVGAGPAGLAAASVCARAGLDTIVLDDAQSPGGNAHRGIASDARADNSATNHQHIERFAKQLG